MPRQILENVNIPKAKQNAIALWTSGGMNALVKVAPAGMKPDGERSAGYCTTIKYLLGRTPSEMERDVGLRVGTKLKNGAEIFLVRPIPTSDQFELRGYTQLPDGYSTSEPDYKAHPDYPPGSGVPQWDLHKYKQDQLKHLASVKPGEKFTFPVAKLASIA